MEIQAQFAQLATGVPFAYTLREAYSLEEGPTYIIRLHRENRRILNSQKM